MSDSDFPGAPPWANVHYHMLGSKQCFFAPGTGGLPWYTVPGEKCDGSFDHTPYEQEYAALCAKWAAERQAEEARIEQAKAFPVEGMSGKFGNSDMNVWATSGDTDDSLYFDTTVCSFCGVEGLALRISDDYCDVDVCRDCLGKMFDAFEAQGEGETG